VGDIVLLLDGKPIENGRQLDVNIYRRAVGETVTLEVVRGDERRVFQIPVVERRDDPARFSEMVTPEKNLIPELGILGMSLDPALQHLIPRTRRPVGVIVAMTIADAPYGQPRFAPGDVIYALNGTRITSLEALREAMEALDVGDPVVLQIERRGRLMYLPLEVE
jgi:serine protease Do